MAKKTIKVNFFYPVVKSEQTKIYDIIPILIGLDKMLPEKRVLDLGEENIQLKRMNYDKKSNRWMLCFLRNKIDAPFKTKLDDTIHTAEALDDDEFVGQECCMIYDPSSYIIALQNNRNSISFSGVSKFFWKFNQKTDESVFLSPIVYQDKYCEISNENGIDYKSVIIGYTDIAQIDALKSMEDKDKAVEFLTKLTNSMNAIGGKIELSVGRSKSFLNKYNLKNIVDFFKKNKKVTSNLKVKVFDGDSIRIIDLLNNKVSDEIDISIAKDDPKTFEKILSALDFSFDKVLKNDLSKCKEIFSRK